MIFPYRCLQNIRTFLYYKWSFINQPLVANKTSNKKDRLTFTWYRNILRNSGVVTRLMKLYTNRVRTHPFSYEKASLDQLSRFLLTIGLFRTPEGGKVSHKNGDYIIETAMVGVE